MEFIKKYTRVGDDSDPEFIDDDDVISEEQVSDREFIDDSTKFYDQQSSNYFFKNVATNLEEAALDQSLSFLDEFEDSDPENYCHSEFDKSEFDNDIFDNFEKRIKKFENELKIFKKNSKDWFCNPVLHTLIFKLTDKKKFITDKNKIQSIIGTDGESSTKWSDLAHFQSIS